jgi:hypothetical protein
MKIPLVTAMKLGNHGREADDHRCNERSGRAVKRPLWAVGGWWWWWWWGGGGRCKGSMMKAVDFEDGIVLVVVDPSAAYSGNTSETEVCIGG